MVLVVAVLVAVLDVARAVAVVLVAVLVLCVVLYRERNGSTIYVKKFPTVLFLVKEIAKLERERFVFCPRLFREGGGRLDDQAQATEKEPLSASTVSGIMNNCFIRLRGNHRKSHDIVRKYKSHFFLI